MKNILSQEVIERNKLVCRKIQDREYWECPDGYPAYSKEFAEWGYEESLKMYPDSKYGWFIAERNGVYWCANGCNANHGIAAGWKIIKKNY